MVLPPKNNTTHTLGRVKFRFTKIIIITIFSLGLFIGMPKNDLNTSLHCVIVSLDGKDEQIFTDGNISLSSTAHPNQGSFLRMFDNSIFVSLFNIYNCL